MIEDVGLVQIIHGEKYDKKDPLLPLGRAIATMHELPELCEKSSDYVIKKEITEAFRKGILNKYLSVCKRVERIRALSLLIPEINKVNVEVYRGLIGSYNMELEAALELYDIQNFEMGEN